ncbi:hypothetical protein B0H14DRAFT_2633223 [Mycena olivaceomarginata]|nr:hypothetical protein B0H14DRAFT_2633223 [Mycena olivaceomarginata]
MSRPPHPPGCLCSSCHLSSKLFPRGTNDKTILPAIHPGPGQDQSPKSPHLGTDRARLAPPLPKSTAPHEYAPRRHAQEPPPPMRPMRAPPRYGDPSSSRRSVDAQRARPPTPMHRPMPTHAHASQQLPPDRPASAMAMASPPRVGALVPSTFPRAIRRDCGTGSACGPRMHAMHGEALGQPMALERRGQQTGIR